MNNKLVMLAYCIENVTDLVAEAEERGFDVEVLVKEGAVLDLIMQHDVGYIVGVCCPARITSVAPNLKEGVLYRAVSTSNGEGCFKQTGSKRRVNSKEYTSALDWLERQK